MGAGLAKLLPYLDIGPEVPEDKIKKSYARVLTTGTMPSKVELLWKSINFPSGDMNESVKNLLAAAEFIHQGRVANKNTIIFTQQEQPNATAFATAYFMILSGLSPEAASTAVTNAVKGTDLKIKEAFLEHLQALRSGYSSIELRNLMFKNAGTLPDSRLTEDVSKIYELCGLPKPTTEQIKLEAVPPSPVLSQDAISPKPTSPMSFFKSRRASKDEWKEPVDSAKSSDADEKHKGLASTNEMGEICPEDKPSSVLVRHMDKSKSVGETEGMVEVTLVSNGVANSHVNNDDLSSRNLNDVVHETIEGTRISDTVEPSMRISMSSNGADSSATSPRKIKIVRSKTTESANTTNEVDEYLSQTSEEQRKDQRRRVSIVRGGSKA
ncbi:unnamed protein product [Dicrocoelium dendriticum]|nr:unnamed protein product [Dicrocoelium dendriticum]